MTAGRGTRHFALRARRYIVDVMNMWAGLEGKYIASNLLKLRDTLVRLSLPKIVFLQKTYDSGMCDIKRGRQRIALW